jgi:spoIIIJ-associated protein
MTEKLSIEIEGKTVEEAIKKALNELKLPRDKVKIEVLSEEEKGLFGMPGAKPAKVRVTVIRSKENT